MDNVKPYVPTELGTENILTLLVRYAVPAIIAMAATSTYNIIDSIFVGQGVGDMAINGMAVASPFMNLSTALGAMVGVGASTVISVRLGQGKYKTAQHVLGNTISLNIVIGTIFTLVCLPFLDEILTLFGASEAPLPYARDYMRIILIGNIITHSYFGLNAVLRSAGHPRTAMYCTFLTIILNTILDPLFIFTFGWGIEGAAWATILSQAVSLMWQLKLFSRKNELLHLRRGIYALKTDIVRQTLAIGLSPFLVNSCSCLVVLLCNNKLLEHGGDMAIGAYGIVNRVLFFFIMIVFGLIQGMQPIIGYNWGAHLNNRVWTVLRLGMIGGSVVTTAAFLVAEFMPGTIMKIFGAGPELTSLSVHGFRIIAAMFPIVGIQIVIGNFFQSIGHAGKSIFLSLTRQLLFLAPLLALLPHWWGLDGVFWAMPASDIISFFVACGMLVWQMKHIKAHNPTEKARG